MRPQKAISGVKERFFWEHSFKEEPAAYQLVGRVTAYQGEDG
jgi:hypothetical protein